MFLIKEPSTNSFFIIPSGWQNLIEIGLTIYGVATFFGQEKSEGSTNDLQTKKVIKLV